MKIHDLPILIATAILTVLGSSAGAADRQPTGDIGRTEYTNNCIACHGEDGKGGGFVTEVLERSPADLTTIAKRNGGAFPVQRAYETIDGRKMIKSDPGRDMPAWGDRYNSYSKENVKAAEYYMDVEYDMEVYAHSRIQALIDYLKRIQVQ